MFKASLLAISLSIISAHAQRIILPQDIKGEAEKKAYQEKLNLYHAEQLRRKPLYIKSAKLATEKLADEILKDNFDYAIANMYPRLKATLSKRVGGEAEFLKRQRKAVDDLRKSKTEIIDIKVSEPTELYYVWMKKKKGLDVIYYPFDYTIQKLVIVPITKHVKFGKINPDNGKPFAAVVNSYQLAIYDETDKRWSFIDGSSITVNEIRNLFPTIPLDIAKKLPKSGKAIN